MIVPCRDVTARAHAWLRPTLLPGATVVDATCGNGHDTLFLARSVAPGGRVLAFDCQALAIERSRRRLTAADPAVSAEWHQCDHADMAVALQHTIVDGAMFNLGWLPRSDSTVVTQPAGTIAALDAVVARLHAGARTTVVCYRGHAGGVEEAQAVADWLTTARVRHLATEPAPANDQGPILYVLEKAAPSESATGADHPRHDRSG